MHVTFDERVRYDWTFVAFIRRSVCKDTLLGLTLVLHVL